ncbi:MAG: DNA primase [Aliivibrio sp.]|nr:DNA primase [Aliivibrio sp.]
MKTNLAAKGQWGLIYKSFGLEIIPNKHQVCPLCGRKGSSGIRIHDKTGNGDYICVCSSGNGFSLLMEMTGLSFFEIAKQIDEIIGNKPDARLIKPKMSGVQKRIASTSKPINGTWSEYYLKERGIFNLPTMSVHHCDSVPYFNEHGVKVGNYEAMVATVTDAQTLEILQQHITYLQGSKKLYRKVRNITDVDYKVPVIRLMGAEKTLGIAEGIETALSAHDKYNIPCWSTINSGFMKRFRAPAGVTKLWIFADNDQSLTGHAAAFECARANLSAKNDVCEVVVAWPDGYGDFNDLKDKDDIYLWESAKRI